MVRTSRKQRYAMFAVSAAIVGGGVLIPTSAFAAPTTAGTTALAAAGQVDHSTKDHRDNKRHNNDKGNGKSKKNQKHQGGKNKVRDVQNMPGCKFYQGKVYCEHKTDKPAPAPKTDPAAPDRETGKAPAPNA
ncbi:hypothetical protein [Streptomyces virginiae]|uniref:hypothetical protein n=1 Tax=Streptomyces virginiae TaxID=1961 RepID=UPI00224F59A5|nr:hypothetical protein [Streptomyces virginiae]MCX4960442.1 hypothetical protein [Streptomyces virginiae]